MRSLLRKIHLWLGLVVGFPFVVLAVTGSVLVFYIEIDTALNLETRTESHPPQPGWSSPVWDQALETAQKNWPDRNGYWSFEATGPAAAIPARYYPPSEHTGHMTSDWTMFWLSMDGTEILREERWGSYLVTFLYDIHRNFLTGDTGRQVVGWSGIAMCVLLITGMLVWWPRGNWSKALAFKRNAVPVRRMRDLHKLSGVWSFPLLFILVLTGVLLALPAEKNWLLSRSVTPVVPVPSPSSTPSTSPRISIAHALSAAQQALPDAKLAWIDVPGPGTGTFRMRVQVPGDPNQRFPQSFVFVDQYSAEVLAVYDARLTGASNTINNWIRPLHDGSIGGMLTRILAVIMGLVPVALFITGLYFWRLRVNARSSSSQSSVTNSSGSERHIELE